METAALEEVDTFNPPDKHPKDKQFIPSDDEFDVL